VKKRVEIQCALADQGGGGKGSNLRPRQFRHRASLPKKTGVAGSCGGTGSTQKEVIREFFEENSNVWEENREEGWGLNSRGEVLPPFWGVERIERFGREQAEEGAVSTAKQRDK